jgi:hypothetical protein
MVCGLARLCGGTGRSVVEAMRGRGEMKLRGESARIFRANGGDPPSGNFSCAAASGSRGRDSR